MPTYEYSCTSCGHNLEVVQSFSDEPLAVCPTCNGPLRKVFGSVGIVLKGSGFYRTDNRSGPSGSNGDSAGTKESGGKSEKATESTPAGSSKGSGGDGSSGSSSGSSKGSGGDGSSGRSSGSSGSENKAAAPAR